MDKRAGLRQEFAGLANEAKREQQYKQRTAQLDALESTVVDAFTALIRFMDGKTTKTEVVNQLKSISTPDVDKVVVAISNLDKDVLANKLDLKPLEQGLNALKRELSLIPKTLPKIPEQRDSVKVTNLSEVKLDTSAVEKAIKALKLDPKIDVKAPMVSVDAPNLKPLQDAMLDLLKAVQKIKIPEVPKTDLKTLEDEAKSTNKKLDTANKKLQELIEKRVGGGGGGGSGTSFVDENGNLTYVETINGSIPVASSSPIYKLLLDDYTTPSVTYVGKAALGSATSSAVWQIQKIDETTGMSITWAQTGLFTAKWDDRLSESYS